MDRPRFDFIKATFFLLVVFWRKPLSTIWLMGWTLALVYGLVFAGLIHGEILLQQFVGLVEGAEPSFALFGTVFLVVFGAAMLFYAVIGAAWMRLLVREDVSAIIPFRIGADEFRLIGLGIWWIIAFLLLMIPVMLVALMPAMALGTNAGFSAGISTGEGMQFGTGGANLATLAMIVILFAGILFISVKFTPATGATILRRKVQLFSAWPQTKGVFWHVVAAFLITLVISLIVDIIQMGGEVYTLFNRDGIDMRVPGLEGEIPVASWSDVPAYLQTPELWLGGAGILAVLVSMELMPYGVSAYIARWYDGVEAKGLVKADGAAAEVELAVEADAPTADAGGDGGGDGGD